MQITRTQIEPISHEVFWKEINYDSTYRSKIIDQKED